MPRIYDEVQKYLQLREIGGKRSLGSNSKLHTELYSSTKCLRFWDPAETSKDTHHGGIFNFDFSSDGSLLVAACEKKSVLMFDPFNGNLIRAKNNAHTDCVNCVRFLDTRCFATCSDDTTVCLWDARYLKHSYRTLRGHSNWVKNIEYDHNQGLLVTSGFDGSIYTWDINRYSENGVDYKRVFHTDGLMRSKLTPDASKLVIATARGYLMVIHNLDLHRLSEDLHGFKPNLYRLMQMSELPLRQGYMFEHLFTRHRNRVELVSDFPVHDEADMIASLEIHPHGWCVVSRNRSSDENSEWTCIHDIQQYDEDLPEEETNNQTVKDGSITRRRSPQSFSNSEGTSQSTSTESSQRYPNHSESQQNTSTQFGSYVFQINYNRLHPVDGSPQVMMTNNPGDDNGASNEEGRPTTHRRPRLGFRYAPLSSGLSSQNLGGSDTGNVNTNRIDSLDPEQSTNQSDTDSDNSNNPDSANTLSRQAVLRIGDSVTVIIRSGSQVAERTLLLMGQQQEQQRQQQQNKDEASASDIKVNQNKSRLTHYIQEPNDGRGFIKEVCFSNDGRLVCSPFSSGIRLLAFDQDCNELCDTVPKQPLQLHRVTSIMSHQKIVVTNKFSPVHKLLVSGCLNGKVCFHQPIL